MIWTMVEMLPGLAAAAVALWLLCKFPARIALGTTALAVLLDCLQIGSDGFNLGVLVYPDDVACAALLVAAVLVVLRSGRVPSHKLWPLVLLCAFAVLTFLRGVMEFGLKLAGNGTRDLIYLIVPALAVSLLRPTLRVDARRVAQWMIVVGCLFAALAILRWGGVLPTPVGLEETSGERQIVRVLNSGQSMLMLDALLAIIFVQMTEGVSWWGMGLAGGFAVVIIYAQHRTVWVAGVVGVLLLAVRTSRTRRAMHFWVATGAAVLIGIGATLAVAPDSVRSTRSLLRSNVAETQQQDSTWEWRVRGYEEAVQRTFSSELGYLMLGPPPGYSFPNSSYSSTHIHDRYIQTLALYGLLAELLLLCWLIVIGKVLFRSPGIRQYSDKTMARAFLQAAFIAELFYFIPYSGGITDGIILGLVWELASSRLSQSRVCVEGGRSHVLSSTTSVRYFPSRSLT